MRYVLITLFLAAGIAGAHLVTKTLVAQQPVAVVCGRTCIG